MMLRGILLGFTLLAAGAGGAQAEQQSVRRAVQSYIRPAYVQLLGQTQALRQDVKALCNRPDMAALDVARARFRKTVEAFAHIEFIRFGPITEDNRLERMLFWPDRKGTGLKQVQAALASNDPSVTSADTLAAKSVAMQGFGALEYVLFGTDAETLAGKDAAYRCSYAAAIAQNLERIAGAVSGSWSGAHGFGQTWIEADNELYHNDQEALTELLSVFVNGLEMVRDVRLDGFLGKEPADDKPKSALFWRSGLTADTLAENMSGMHEMFDLAQMGETLPADMQWLPDSIDFEFKNAEAAIGAASAKPIARSARGSRAARQTRLFPRRHHRPVGPVRAAAGRCAGRHRRLFLPRRRLRCFVRRCSTAALFCGQPARVFWLSLSPRAAVAIERTDAVFATAFQRRDGAYGVAVLIGTAS